LPNSLKGYLILSGCIALSLCGGCGRGRGVDPAISPAPLSNAGAAERAIGDALDGLGLPDGGGSEITWTVEGDAPGAELVDIVVPGFLADKGYAVVGGTSRLPNVRFIVETVRVTLSAGEGGGRDATVSREALARISGEYTISDGTRRVYRGEGWYRDRFPRSLAGSLGRTDAVVVDRLNGSPVITRIQPLVIGFAITLIAWMLYSYRG